MRKRHFMTQQILHSFLFSVLTMLVAARLEAAETAIARPSPTTVRDWQSGNTPFLTSQEQVLYTIDLAQGLAIDRVKIRSVFDRRIRYSVWSSFCANASHQRRHLWQAECVAQQIEKSACL
jgi:hypothetical protein